MVIDSNKKQGEFEKNKEGFHISKIDSNNILNNNYLNYLKFLAVDPNYYLNNVNMI